MAAFNKDDFCMHLIEEWYLIEISPFIFKHFFLYRQQQSQIRIVVFVIHDTGLQVPPVHNGPALDGAGCHDFPHGGRQRDRHHQSDREYPQVLLLFTCIHCSKLPWVVI